MYPNQMQPYQGYNMQGMSNQGYPSQMPQYQGYSGMMPGGQQGYPQMGGSFGFMMPAPYQTYQGFPGMGGGQAGQGLLGRLLGGLGAGGLLWIEPDIGQIFFN